MYSILVHWEGVDIKVVVVKFMMCLSHGGIQPTLS